MFEDFKRYLRQLKVFALGKGILSVAVFGAAAVGAAFGIGVWLPALVVGIGGTVLTAANQLYQQSLQQQEMVDAYRDGIATQLHIAPEEVTVVHLKEAAKENRVIAHELNQQRKKTILTISTAALAGAVSIALIGVFDMGNVLHELARGSFSGIFEPLVSLVGMGTVSAASGLVLHDGLDAAIGYKAGLHKSDANDLILSLHRQVQRGQPISREQVYAVVVADDPILQARIRKDFHRPYERLSPPQQSHLLHKFGVAQKMDALAVALSNQQMKPGQLAFLTEDFRPQAAQPATANAEAANGDFVARMGLKPVAQLSQTEKVVQQRLAAEPAMNRA